MIRRIFVIYLLLISSCTPVSYLNIKVKKVIDGDTVLLENGKLLRYIGIDTPEIRTKTKDGTWRYNPSFWALKAKQFNAWLVEGKKVKVEFDIQKTDKYGRLLGYVFLKDGRFVNELLLREGLGILYTFPPNIKYIDTLILAQKWARQNKKGLWNDNLRSVKFLHSLKDRICTFRIKVKKCFCLKDKCILSADSKIKSFEILIPRKNLELFCRERICDICKYYLDKDVEVTGRLRRQNSHYYVIVTVPENIILR